MTEPDTKPHICYVLPRVPSLSGAMVGTAKVRLLRQAQDFSKKGYMISAVTLTPDPTPVEGVQFHSFTQPGYYKKQTVIGMILRALYAPVYFFRIYIFLKKINPDVFHQLSGYSVFLLFSIVAGKLLRKRVVTEVTLYGGNDIATITSGRISFLKKLIISKVDAVVNLSPLLLENCKEVLSEGQCTIIGNQVDTDRYRPLKSKNEKYELRRNLGLNEQGLVIVHVGTTRPRKGQKMILEIFQELLPQYPEAHMVFLGENDCDREAREYFQELIDFAEQYEMREHVKFMGRVNNVPEWYRASDIFIFASEREGLPNAVLGAMATGLPVVMKEMPGTSEFMIEPGENGYIFTEKKEAVNLLTNLANSAEDRFAVGAEAVKTIQSKFTKDVIFDAYAKVYAHSPNHDDSKG